MQLHALANRDGLSDKIISTQKIGFLLFDKWII